MGCLIIDNGILHKIGSNERNYFIGKEMWEKVHDHGTHWLRGRGMEAAVLPRAGSASER